MAGIWEWNADQKGSAGRSRRRSTDWSGPAGYGGPPLTFKLKPYLVDALVGKKGKKIKDIQTATNTRIHVVQDKIEAVVNIFGTSAMKLKAKGIIEIIVKREEARYILKQSQAQAASAAGTSRRRPSLPPGTKICTTLDWDRIRLGGSALDSLLEAKLPPIKKDFYVESVSTKSMTQMQVQRWRQKNFQITCQDPRGGPRRDFPNPTRTFEDAFKNYRAVIKYLKRGGFKRPTPIQAQAWPIVLKGQDLIGAAQTGSGKTLSYLLPGFIHLQTQPLFRHRSCGAGMLILTPTRELALQLEDDCSKYTGSDFRSVCVYSGGSRTEQINSISQGADIIIATPDRLNDLKTSSLVNLKGITYLVLDDVDKMVHLGFEEQIKGIVELLRRDRQTVVMSASWSHKLWRVVQSYVKEPLLVVVRALNLAEVQRVKQTIVITTDQRKQFLLQAFLDRVSPSDKVIVFVRRKHHADQLARDLRLQGVPVQSLHDTRQYRDPQHVLEDFKSGKVNILIATDLGSRGLDLRGITRVYNYDFPRKIDDYIYRVGLAGRARHAGVSVSLLTQDNRKTAHKLVKVLKKCEQTVPAELMLMAREHHHRHHREMRTKGHTGI
ncbi:DEAD box protein 53 [Tenrec ecaudatus]|uniref:DEAD box protein 53 n=1 Tax=Tenrec ecaudatus TaxID=94439 RepID=UPI003F59232A